MRREPGANGPNQSGWDAEMASGFAGALCSNAREAQVFVLYVCERVAGHALVRAPRAWNLFTALAFALLRAGTLQRR